ncbi:MAG TPA: zf-TFIIB domain-containing protein [Verrucomicrobiae bacterium]|nr:zf-TFIIB domain-containing protein [Verrucomicrobiae bacterium]
MNCPRCESELEPLIYDGLKIEVCPKCKGEWLFAGELQKIVEHHDEVFTPEEIASLEPVNKEIFTAESQDHDELNCPVCAVQMEHFNYGDTSGIILHKCLECGGIWMDKGELQEIEGVVDGWKDCLGKDTAKYGGVLEKIDAEEQKQLDQSVSISRFGFVNAVLRHFCENFNES